MNFAQARTNMVDCQIHTSGVVHPEILKVFENIPREIFLPKDKQALAYSDEDVLISGRLYMMEPMVHARLLEAADLQAEDVVLDIGCASGYSSAILSPLVSTVLAVEEDAALSEAAQTVWKNIETCNIAAITGQLSEGNPDNAPYDKALINGAVAEIPVNIVSQLKAGGTLYCVLKEVGQKNGKAVEVRHLGDDKYSVHILFDASTPYARGFEPKPSFVF